MFDQTNGFEKENESQNTLNETEAAQPTEKCTSDSEAQPCSDGEGICNTAEESEIETVTEAAAEEANSTSEDAPDFGGGVYYSTATDGTVANGYEWNTQNDRSEKIEEKKSKKESSGNGFKIFIAATLTVFTLSVLALTALVANYAFDSEETSSPKETATPYKEQNSSNYDYSNVTVDNPNFVAFDFKKHEGQVLSIPEIAAKCTPSSVGIISEIETTYNNPFYFSPTTRIAEASGSGFIYSADGYVITNHHVIEDATKITVVLSDGSEYDATLVGSDDLSDIAVLKITPDEDTRLIPMELGNSDELVVGEPVVAIGCPAGVEFIGTVTDGIVSAINRNVELTDSYGNIQKTMTLIQTNATINHGNSGGPLINSRGQVIGINTLKLSSNYEGIGFSIPINGAAPVISQLIEHGKVIERTEEDFAYGKGMIGINGTEISDDEAEYYGIPKGVLVIQIDRESSAAKAGLRRGDIITHYNGTEVSSVDDINSLKGSARAGTEVTLTVYRDGNSGEGESIDIIFKLDAQK